LDSDQVECPYCAEVIRAKARFCRFCQRELILQQEVTPPRPVSTTELANEMNAAIVAGDVREVAKLLQQRGMDVKRHDKFGVTPLRCAVRNDQHEIAALLQQHTSYSEGFTSSIASHQAPHPTKSKLTRNADGSVLSPQLICPHCHTKGSVC
jgi:hypothetical protein